MSQVSCGESGVGAPAIHRGFESVEGAAEFRGRCRRPGEDAREAGTQDAGVGAGEEECRAEPAARDAVAMRAVDPRSSRPLLWGTRLAERVAPPELILLVLVLIVARWALTAAARREVLVIALQIGHAITFSAFHLASVLLLARLVPAESRTAGQALSGGVAFGLGGSVGLALAGALVDRVSTSCVFALEAVAALVGLVPALRLRRLVGADGAPPS